jgi:hypothetical protein
MILYRSASVLKENIKLHHHYVQVRWSHRQLVPSETQTQRKIQTFIGREIIKNVLKEKLAPKQQAPPSDLNPSSSLQVHSSSCFGKSEGTLSAGRMQKFLG